MQLSKEKLRSIQNERKEIEENLLPQAYLELKEAFETGDGEHDNILIQMARQKVDTLSSKLETLQDTLKDATEVVIDRNSSKVNLGNVVTIRDTDNNIKKFTLVDEVEANSREGKFSNLSPIGSAVLNRRVGDKIRVQIASEVKEYEIVEIE